LKFESFATNGSFADVQLRSQEFKLKRLQQKVEDVKCELGRIREIAPADPGWARQRTNELSWTVMTLEHDTRMFEREMAEAIE